MSDRSPPEPSKTLQLRQTWFLGVMAAAVILMFSFVILPYVDPPAKMSGQQASSFDWELLSGGDPGDRVRLEDLQGKIVVLDFWASWCAPCRQQSAALKLVSDKLGDDVYLLGVATSDRRESAAEFVKQEELPYPNAFDDSGLSRTGFGVETLPALIVIDQTGQVKAKESRVLSADEIISLVEIVRASGA